MTVTRFLQQYLDGESVGPLTSVVDQRSWKEVCFLGANGSQAVGPFSQADNG